MGDLTIFCSTSGPRLSRYSVDMLEIAMVPKRGAYGTKWGQFKVGQDGCGGVLRPQSLPAPSGAAQATTLLRSSTSQVGVEDSGSNVAGF